MMKWRYTKEQREQMHHDLGKLTRRQLEVRFIDQSEQVQRFLRAIKKLKQAINELMVSGF